MKSHLLYSLKRERKKKKSKDTQKMYLQNQHIPWKSIENYCSFRSYFFFVGFVSLEIAIKMSVFEEMRFLLYTAAAAAVAAECSVRRIFQKSKIPMCRWFYFIFNFCSVRNRGRYFVKFNKFEWLDEISVISSDVCNRIFIMNIAIPNTRRFEWIQIFREKKIIESIFQLCFGTSGVFFLATIAIQKKLWPIKFSFFVERKMRKKQSPALLHNLVKKCK